MLTETEERKLEYLLEIINLSKTEGRFPQLSAYDILWLAEQLKESNDLVKRLVSKGV